MVDSPVSTSLFIALLPRLLATHASHSPSLVTTNYPRRTRITTFVQHRQKIMVYRASLLLLASAAGVGLVAAQDSVRFGPYFSLGATTSYIVEAETTIYPGKTPSPQQARLALWPGMGTDAGDLIQTIVLSSTDAEAVNCGGKPRVAGEWCVFASALQDGTQVDGVTYPVTATQGATINYKYDATTGNTTQTVSVGGKAVSELSTKSGRAIGWGTAVECQDQCSGIVNAHSKFSAISFLELPLHCNIPWTDVARPPYAQRTRTRPSFLLP